MSPRVSKKERGDLPKPVVQQGTFGFYPLNNLALALLHEEQADLILGERDKANTLDAKEKGQASVKLGKRKQSVSVKGRVFNGISDSFYRGKLPHVILCAMTIEELEAFAEEFLDHIDKMFSLGFFLQKADPVEELVPCFVVAANGMFYNSLMNKFSKTLGNMKQLDKRTGEKILGKFVRGIFNHYEPQCYIEGSKEQVFKPSSIKIAGGHVQNQIAIQSVLSSRGFSVLIEKAGENPPERIEFENAFHRIVSGMIPALKEGGQLGKAEAKAMTGAVQDEVLALGQKRKVFGMDETVKTIAAQLKNGNDPLVMAPGDAAILQTLEQMAKYYEHSKAVEVFAGLKEKINQISSP